MISSLYVHFPFCETKCQYCDFYSIGKDKTNPNDLVAFESALHTEVKMKASQLAPKLKTIFLGGGTPSMTAPDSMARALEPLWKVTETDADTEWTMEANPSSVSSESLKEYKSLGVNRISLGVQALRPDLLSWLTRVHSQEAAIAAVEKIFSAGFENVSVDLLCGVPKQSLEDLEMALEYLGKYPITHLSCYLLTLPKHHRFYADLPDEEVQLSHLLFVDRFLKERGFEHYEISNYCKPGKQARHNLAYWKGESYLGLGPSAHSFDAEKGVRSKNVSSLHKYAERLQESECVTEWSESLTEEQKTLESWMLGLRLDEGVPKSWFDTTARIDWASKLEIQGLLESHPLWPSRLRLTAKGFALSDQIIERLAFAS